MGVRAKMHCNSIVGNTIQFSCLYDPDLPEDQRLTKATPWGELRMAIDNPAALAQFKAGESYYLDFTPIKKEST